MDNRLDGLPFIMTTAGNWPSLTPIGNLSHRLSCFAAVISRRLWNAFSTELADRTIRFITERLHKDRRISSVLKLPVYGVCQDLSG